MIRQQATAFQTGEERDNRVQRAEAHHDRQSGRGMPKSHHHGTAREHDREHAAEQSQAYPDKNLDKAMLFLVEFDRQQLESIMDRSQQPICESPQRAKQAGRRKRRRHDERVSPKLDRRAGESIASRAETRAGVSRG